LRAVDIQPGDINATIGTYITGIKIGKSKTMDFDLEFTISNAIP